MIITIDGQSGLGKSTIAGKLATQRQMHHINSGKIYRFVTWKALQSCPEIREEDVREIAGEIDIMAANDMSDAILRSDSITTNVNTVSKIKGVRESINHALRSQTQGQSFVLDGRDMCLVFPDADFKFVFQASKQDRLWLATVIIGKPYADAVKILSMRDKDEPFFQYPDDVIYLNPIDALRSGNQILQTIDQIIVQLSGPALPVF